jgi:hypothetical protein
MLKGILETLTPPQVKIAIFGLLSLAMIGLLLGVYFYGRHDGAAANEVKWQKWQAEYFEELKEKIEGVQKYASEQTAEVKKGTASTNARVNTVLEEIRKKGPTVIYDAEKKACEFKPGFQLNWSTINKEANK